MKTIFSLLFIFLLTTASATNYYFSTQSGDDSRSAAQAQNASTPWKSINKLNAVFGTLQPGDSILFKRGETFYGTITITKSGTSAAPIVIGAYGSGNKPIITSLVTLSGWTANSAYPGVYESAANSSFGSQVNILLVNNVQKGIGRYPNAGAVNGGYLTLESHSGLNSITDKELTSTPNWKGAEVVIRTNRWTVDRSIITAHSGGTLTYSNSTAIPARDGYGYFVQNDIKTLDLAGEWYFNSGTKKMSVFFGSSNPSSVDVKAATKDNLVYSLNMSNVTISNLELKGCNGESVSINGGTNVSVKNSDISFSGLDGVFASGSNFKLESCTVINSNNDGVDVSRSNGAIVRNNIIRNSYTLVGMGQSGNGQGAGVRNCTNGLIEYNQIINSGYVGINMGGDNSVIAHNLIDTFGYVKDDGGGIYTSNHVNSTNKGRKVTGNIVLNGLGAPNGTDAPNTSSADGIYFDDNSNGIDLSDNTVANCNVGIYLHNSRSITVRNNTFYNSKNGQIYMRHDDLGDPLRNHTITNNIFFSKLITQLASSISSIADDISSTGKIDSNYYARPIDDGTTIYSSYVSSAGNKVSSLYDLPTWRSVYVFDRASKTSSKQIDPYTISNTVGSNKFAAGSFTNSADVQVVWANSCNLSWNNSGLLDAGYLKVAPTAAGSSIVVSVGGLSTSKKYILKYSVKGSGNMTIAANLRASNYSPLTPLKYWPIGTSRSDNEMLFTPLANETNGSLVFTADAQQTFYIDNIQVYEAIATPTNPDDSIKLVYNPTVSNRTISLNGNYVDVKNKKYSGSIDLKPYTSAVLIKDGAVTNASPTVKITGPADSAKFTTGANITINTTAADPDGSVSKVEFYDGKTLIGSNNNSPYSFTWNNVPAGTHQITAVASDNSGASTTSAAVTVIVSGVNAAPKVTLTSPTANTNYQAPASIVLSADASDSDGTVVAVEFYNGNSLITTEKISPYSWTWNNVQAGSYTITAKAIDNDGASTTSASVTVLVSSPNNAPTVNITSPASNATFTSPASITINATAADSDGSISKVEFYNGNTIIGSDNTSSYSFTWNNVSAGTYTITARAIDNAGTSTTSGGVTVVVGTPNIAPAVTLTSPVANASYSGPAAIILSADASDPDGTISKVEFYDGTNLITTEKIAPYYWTWNNVPAGKYTITAKAFDDKGFVTTSTSVPVVVNYINGAPGVSITSPANNATFTSPASITINATATDPDGSVSKVDFYNGNVFIGSDNSSPYSINWNSVAAGTYSITAIAVDNSGTSTTSGAVVVVVDKPNLAPNVALTSPVTNASYSAPASIILSADASDTDGSVSQVDFYEGGNLITTEKVAPYYWTWNNVQPGKYTITAKATDDDGAVTTSTSVVVVVSVPNSAPTVSITNPATNSAFTSPASITIDATAADADGSVSKVEFYNGSMLIGSDDSSPYSFTWDNVAAGNYTITAKAVDNSGAASASAPVGVVVSSPNILPTVTITSPAVNTNFTAPAGVTINATAADSDGSVDRVEFYNGSTLLGSDDGIPYSFSWNNVSAGSFTITAKAIDDKGAIGTSSAITINVAPIITFLEFSGDQLNKNIQLNWKTNNPGNQCTFKIQRGKRSYSFKEIGTLHSVSGTTSSLDYSFTDSTPLTGRNYYRIVGVDGFGNVVNSSIILVNYNSKTFLKSSTVAHLMSDLNSDLTTKDVDAVNIKLGPNPASTMMSVYIDMAPTNKSMQLDILTIDGKLVKTIQSNSAIQKVDMDVSFLKSGTYLLRIVSGDKTIARKFVKL